MGAGALAAVLLTANYCDLKTGRDAADGVLEIHFVGDCRLPVAQEWEIGTQAGAVPDTNEFILSITDVKGASRDCG